MVAENVDTYSGKNRWEQAALFCALMGGKLGVRDTMGMEFLLAYVTAARMYAWIKFYAAVAEIDIHATRATP